MREEQREFEDHLLWPDSVLESTYGKAYADMVRTEKKRRRMKTIPILNVWPQPAPHTSSVLVLNKKAVIHLMWTLFKSLFKKNNSHVKMYASDGEAYTLTISVYANNDSRVNTLTSYYTDWEVEKELMARANSDNLVKETQKVLEELSDFEAKFNE